MSRHSSSFRQALRADVTRFLNEAASDRRARAEALQAERTAFTSSLRASVTSELSESRERIQQDVQTMMDDIRAEREARSEALRQSLREFRNLLREEAATLHRVAPAPAELVAPIPAPAPVAPVASQAAPEDLLRIRGIGPNTLKRLREAGIRTFSDLAASSPDDLRQALGEYAKLINVEEWLEQARKLADTP